MKKNKYIKIEKDKLLISIISILIFFLIELTARMYNWYELYPSYDILIHIISGVAFVSLYWIFKSKKKLSLIKLLIINLGLSILWEILEFIGDKLFYTPEYLKDIFIYDGLSDIVFGLIGVVIGYYILNRK